MTGYVRQKVMLLGFYILNFNLKNFCISESDSDMLTYDLWSISQ